MKQIVLLLTATVTPQVDVVVLQDPKERLRQYVAAIKWYMEHTPYKMIIGENSGCYDFMDHVPREYRERIEYICYQTSTQNVTENYGYYEVEILKQIDARSAFLREGVSAVFKITGRLILKNINAIMRSETIPETDFLCGDIAGPGSFLNTHMDTRFMLFSPSILPLICSVQHFLLIYSFDDMIEKHIYRIFLPLLKKDIQSVRCFKLPFIVEGIWGFEGTSYKMSVFETITAYMRTAVHYLRWTYKTREIIASGAAGVS